MRKIWAMLRIIVLCWLLFFAVDCLLNGSPYDLRIRILQRFPDFLDSINTEGLRYVITAIGIACFFLTYINASRTKRVKGILMDDVISTIYPYYGWFFFLHGCFVALGIYSCSVGSKSAGLLCMCGILLCLLYLLLMAVYTTFSRRAGECLVRKYIKFNLKKLIKAYGILRKTERLAMGGHSLLMRIRLCIFWQIHPFKHYTTMTLQKAYKLQNDNALRKLIACVSRYVAHQFSNRELYTDDIVIKSSNNDLVLLLSLASVKYLPKGHDGYSHKNHGFLSEFNDMFGALMPASIIHCIPAAQSSCLSFQAYCVRCAELWTGIFSEINGSHSQAELAYYLFCASYNTQIVPALCCGLLLFFQMKYDKKYGNNLLDDRWEDCMNFLLELSQIQMARNGRDGNNIQGPDGIFFQTLLRDMGITSLCLWELENTAANMDLKSQSVLRATLELMNDCRGNDAAICCSDEAIKKYLCYAMIVLRTLTNPSLCKPTRSDIFSISSPIVRLVISKLNNQYAQDIKDIQD